MIKNFNELTVVQGQNVPILGFITWLSTPQAFVPTDIYIEAYERLGLPKEELLKPTSVADAYSLASSGLEIKRKKGKVEENEETFRNVLVTEITNTPKLAIRKIVVQTIDPSVAGSDDDIVHSVEGIIRLDKEKNEITFENLKNDPILEDLKRKFYADYQLYRTHFHSQKIRGPLTRLIKRMDPVKIKKTGGVYFVPYQYEEPLDRLGKFIEVLNKHAKSIDQEPFEFIMVEVAGKQEMIEMVRRAYEAEMLADIQEHQNELRVLLEGSGKIDKRTVFRMFDRIKEMQKKASTYRQLLSEKVMQLDTHFEILKQQANALLEKVDDEAEDDGQLAVNL